MSYEQIKENNQTVYLNDNRGNNGFITNKYGPISISNLNHKIYKYLEEVYKPYGYTYPRGSSKCYDINIDGRIINTDYISKLINNYTIFKSFIREYDIKDEENFYNKIISNFYNVYHYNGEFFNKQSLPIVINTTRKGNINEKRCKFKFEEYAKSKGLNINIEDPTISEDVRGIDGKFLFKNRYITMQIKPFISKLKNDSYIYCKSNGSLSLGLVNYLILYSGNKCIILRNDINNPIKIKGDIFISPLQNILYED